MRTDRASFQNGSAEAEASGRPRPGRVYRFASAGLAAAGICGVLALIAPLLWSPDLDSESSAHAVFGFAELLTEVFAFHGGLVLLALGGIALAMRRRVLAGVLVALGMVHAGPGLVASGRAAWGSTERPAATLSVAGEPADATLTVLSHNLLFSRAGLDRLDAIVERERPDVVMLQEVVVERAPEVLDRLGDRYPHIVHPGTHRWGGMLLSRHPFVEVPEPLPGEPAWPIEQPIGVVELGGVRIGLVGVHLPAPTGSALLLAGPPMTARLAARVEVEFGGAPGSKSAAERGAGPTAEPGSDKQSALDAVILAGDFNAPLWTDRMRALRGAGLRAAHAEAGVGRGSTWPAHNPVLASLPGVRLDQVVFRGDLVCVESRVLEATGSDHRPVLATFRVGPKDGAGAGSAGANGANGASGAD